MLRAIAVPNRHAPGTKLAKPRKPMETKAKNSQMKVPVRIPEHNAWASVALSQPQAPQACAPKSQIQSWWQGARSGSANCLASGRSTLADRCGSDAIIATPAWLGEVETETGARCLAALRLQDFTHVRLSDHLLSSRHAGKRWSDPGFQTTTRVCGLSGSK